MAGAEGGAPFEGEMRFEWDENKRRANVDKHAIDFGDARDVFDDPNAFTYASHRAGDERRYVTVGVADGVLMAVVFTRRGPAIRIISARAARRSERESYGQEER